ncbi:hypothetical protein [Psychroserpens ponticola]|uniref:Lipoprotein n=1 Tax=Psychroserpens ponticola TaxID=2932268 RepID=A0ABY7RVS9_9FLAO|nr:hypothetical protein [Psychroserpens ponticola]WCO01039.1 hypothetical protein MUN68_013315 [Psychroserpens ponticola]
MKHIILVLFSLSMLTSCNFTEEITFNEDGSGEFIMSYDMSEVMKTLEKEMGGGQSKEGKEKVKLDSVVYFKDLLVDKADSIATLPLEEQKQLKALESVVMKMRMDEANGIFDFGFGSSFASLKELPKVLEKIEQAKKLNSKDNPQYSKMDESAVSRASQNMFEYVDFAFDGKTFSRSLKKDYKQSPEDIEALDKEISEMGEAKDMFGAMSYTLIYRFPKTVKSVTNDKAVISENGKMVTLKMNFIDMIKSPETMTLDVVLED